MSGGAKSVAAGQAPLPFSVPSVGFWKFVVAALNTRRTDCLFTAVWRLLGTTFNWRRDRLFNFCFDQDGYYLSPTGTALLQELESLTKGMTVAELFKGTKRPFRARLFLGIIEGDGPAESLAEFLGMWSCLTGDLTARGEEFMKLAGRTSAKEILQHFADNFRDMPLEPLKSCLRRIVKYVVAAGTLLGQLGERKPAKGTLVFGTELAQPSRSAFVADLLSQMREDDRAAAVAREAAQGLGAAGGVS